MKVTVANRAAAHCGKPMAEPQPTLLAFGALLQRRRIAKGLSMNLLCKITGLHSGHACYVQKGRVRLSPHVMRVLASILDIADIEAWIIACWGLEGPITFEQAQRVADIVGRENHPVDPAPYLRRIPRMNTCARCGHEWRAKTKRRPGQCPHCRTSKWDAKDWTEEKERTYQMNREKSRSWWRSMPLAERRRIVFQRTGRGKA